VRPAGDGPFITLKVEVKAGGTIMLRPPDLKTA